MGLLSMLLTLLNHLLLLITRHFFVMTEILPVNTTPAGQ
jgi:hypothetical protein